MFKFRYQIKRLRNMGREWLRLVKLYTTPHKGRGPRWHLLHDWKMNGTVWDPSRGLMGREYRLVYVRDPKNPKYSSVMRGDDGKEIRVKRDIFDQIVDTISGIVSLFWRNIFIETTCSHPHDRVWVEWDGDEEYGYYSQHLCDRCGGYLNIKDVDRYLPPKDRHPELIRGNPINPMDRPEAVARRERLEMDDDAVYSSHWDYN